MDYLVNQQREDEERGLNILRTQYEMDTSLRRAYENQLQQPLTIAEQQLLANPPHYTTDEIEADAKALKFKCPIIQAIPSLDDIVQWHGHFYSSEALKDMQSRPLQPTTDGTVPMRRNPLTNEPANE